MRCGCDEGDLLTGRWTSKQFLRDSLSWRDVLRWEVSWTLNQSLSSNQWGPHCRLSHHVSALLDGIGRNSRHISCYEHDVQFQNPGKQAELHLLIYFDSVFHSAYALGPPGTTITGLESPIHVFQGRTPAFRHRKQDLVIFHILPMTPLCNIKLRSLWSAWVSH